MDSSQLHRAGSASRLSSTGAVSNPPEYRIDAPMASKLAPALMSPPTRSAGTPAILVGFNVADLPELWNPPEEGIPASVKS